MSKRERGLALSVLDLSAMNLRSILSHDLAASFVVFLVAVPLSLGIALACNAPLAAGLLGAIVGGLVVGPLSGAPLQVSGPANGIIVIVFGLVTQLGGDWRAVCAITVLSGIVQLLLGALRVARLALAISPAVIQGMLAGIGVLLALGQLHVVLGGAPQSSALANLAELPQQIATLHGGSALLGLLTIGLLYAWRRLPWRAARSIPAPLVALVAATLTSLGLDGIERVKLGTGGLAAAIALPVWPDAPLSMIAGSVVALALVTSVESLLSAVGTDKLHDFQRANLDRELLAQGAGNIASGLVGGLPISGVIVRSSTNLAAGARSRAASILHGVWVIVFVTLFGSILEAIPKSVLAALLVFVGASLLDPARVRSLVKQREGAAFFVTLTGVVFLDLLRGVALGVALTVVLLVWRAMRVGVAIQRGENEVRVRLHGALSFVGVPKLLETLESIPAGTRVMLDMNGLAFVDHAGREALESFRAGHERRGGKVDLVGSDKGVPA